MLRATSIAPPLSLAKIRVQASANCAPPAHERATPAVSRTAKHIVLNVMTIFPQSPKFADGLVRD
jgi:hypothetical protein